MIEAGKTYTLDETDVYRAELIESPFEGFFLKDLNRSAMWSRVYTNKLGKEHVVSVGYAEGYQVVEGKAKLVGFDIGDSSRNIWPDTPDVSLPIASFKPCGTEKLVIDLTDVAPVR